MIGGERKRKIQEDVCGKKLAEQGVRGDGTREIKGIILPYEITSLQLIQEGRNKKQMLCPCVSHNLGAAVGLSG